MTANVYGVTLANLLGWLNVQAPPYNATGNGTTDDTAAIQAALNAVPANGGTVYLPTGTYKITSTLTASVTGTRIVGNGWSAQILYDGSVVTTAITPTGNIRCFVQDIRVSQSNTSHLGTALDWSGCSSSTIERVLIDGGGGGVAPNIGIKLNASTCHYNVIRDCRINYGGTTAQGISIQGSSHSNVVDNVRLIPQGDDVNSSGIYIVNTHSTTLIRPDIESAAGNGVFLDTAAHGTAMYNVYCDTNNINLKISSGVIAPSLFGGTLQGGVTANVQDNGAIGPVYFNAWPNSGTTDLNKVYLVGGNFGVSSNLLVGSTTPLGDNGAGEFQLADATTVPTTSPTAGSTVYSESSTAHPLKLRDTSGNVRSLVDGFFQLATSPTFTSATQTATPVTLTVAASATYVMEAALIFSNTTGSTTPSWTGPTGATMQWNDTGASLDYSSTIGATNNSYASNAGTRMAFFKGLLVTSTTAGSLTLTLGVSAGTTTLSAGSYLRLTRVK
jgi:hypothetical protein